MYLLFDIGGTNTRISAAASLNEVGEVKMVDTPQEFDEGLEVLKEEGMGVLDGQIPKAVVVGFAGVINHRSDFVEHSPHLPNWVRCPLKKDLEDKFRCPVYLENDTALSGLGEVTFGAGSGEELIAYVTVSTGVGGVRLTNGQIDPTYFNFEIGHQIMDLSSDLTAGSLGSGSRLEDLISGVALEKKFGVKPYEIQDEAVWNDIARFLAYGLHNVILHWSPEKLILGGSQIVGHKGRVIDIDLVRKHLEEVVYVFPELPAITKAELGEETGLWGGLAFLGNNLENI